MQIRPKNNRLEFEKNKNLDKVHDPTRLAFIFNVDGLV